MSDRMTAAEYRQAVRDAWTEQEFTDAVIALFHIPGCWPCIWAKNHTGFQCLCDRTSPPPPLVAEDIDDEPGSHADPAEQ